MATLNPSAFLTNRRNDPANLLAVIPGPSSSYRRGNLSDLSRGNSFEDITQVSEQEKISPKSVEPTDQSGDENPPPDNSSAYPILTGPKCPNPNTTAGCTNQNWVVDTGPTQNIVEQLFKELLKMREQVGDLDEKAGMVFARMNALYENSWVNQRCVAAAHQQHHRSHRHQRAAKLHAVHPDRRRNGRHSWASAPSQVTAAGAGGSQQAGQAGGQPSGSKGAQSAGQGSSTQPASGSPSGATSTTGSNDFTVVMEVHRFANFNLVGGVMAIHAKNYSFATEPEYASFSGTTGISTGTTTAPQFTYSVYVTCPPNPKATSSTPGAVPINGTSNSASVTPSPSPYFCINQTQTASLQPAGMVASHGSPGIATISPEAAARCSRAGT